MRVGVLVAGSVLTLIMTADAFAICFEPSPPWGGAPSKPHVPFCVNEWNNTHTCDDWEIERYNADVQRYNREVQEYIDELREYVEDAVEYAECEISSLD